MASPPCSLTVCSSYKCQPKSSKRCYSLTLLAVLSSRGLLLIMAILHCAKRAVLSCGSSISMEAAMLPTVLRKIYLGSHTYHTGGSGTSAGECGASARGEENARTIQREKSHVSRARGLSRRRRRMLETGGCSEETAPSLTANLTGQCHGNFCSPKMRPTMRPTMEEHQLRGALSNLGIWPATS
jgi:hypothetical protein